MAKITVLDKSVAELIAAGEVVERPASIVKELIENSIDAGSTKVTVEIKGGGIGYLRITDNGSGIERDDIENAFLRHATSKLKSADDLEAIGTLGFRGEALASVAAVSKVELTTKTADSLAGWHYEVHGGVALEIPEQIGTAVGTTFVTRDIFYNTPARMKFLKSDIAEANAVAQVVDKAALSNPEIAFTFINNTKVRLQTSGSGDLQSVIAAIYGREFATDMLKVDYNFENKINVYGYVGKPSNSKPTRTYQTFYINKRFVRTRTCSVAVDEAFKGKLMTGRFPVCVLFVELDPSQVDANVHPAKIEVRFSFEKEIYNAVYFAVKNAINKEENPIFKSASPKVEYKFEKASEADKEYRQQKIVQEPVKTKSNEKVEYKPITITEEVSPTQVLNLSSSTTRAKAPSLSEFRGKSSYKKPDVEYNIDIFKPVSKQSKDTKEATTETAPIVGEEVTSPVIPEPRKELRLIGEFLNTYILLENEEKELLVVDKHAAHERIKYEELIKNSESGMRQVLLAAVPVTLQRDEYSVLIENLHVLAKLGFLADDFGTGTIIIRETATELANEDISFLMSEIASKLLEGKKEVAPEAISRLYYSIACKSAVRAGDRNNSEELREIIRKLEINSEITHCPHGRPVAVKISKNEIEKMFGRLG